MDKKGPTAVLNSCAKIDTLETYNHLFNQKFQPQFLEGEMKPLFIDYLKTWREKKIPHVQFNIVDRETLMDAKQRPEEYLDLIVRVAGYSAYFVELSEGLQDHIIKRTEQNLS
jgi:formate C-acetyltransferase